MPERPSRLARCICEQHRHNAYTHRVPYNGYCMQCPCTVEPTLDRVSSASRQHFIDTGHYLPEGEQDA